MKKKKLLFIFGTRPEALKLAPVILAAKMDTRFQGWTCLTGQHRQMVDQVLSLFNIRPDFDLNIMRPAQGLGQLTAFLFEKLDVVFRRVKPDVVIVQGDTTTVFVAALKSFYEKIPIAHVEAGLRSYDKYQPFPEEVNRVLVSRIADYSFPPTREAYENLRCEGIKISKEFITGNTVVDALKLIKHKISNPKGLIPARFKKKRIILVTAHRRESFGEPLLRVFRAIKTIVKKFPDVAVVYPVHLNPEVQRAAEKILQNDPSILLLPPVVYSEFVALMQASYLILTDSGGVQEEAPTFRKPVLVLRNVSERPDGIRLGIAKLVGTSEQKIITEVSRLLCDRAAYIRMIAHKNPYGDGKASSRILNLLYRGLNA